MINRLLLLAVFGFFFYLSIQVSQHTIFANVKGLATSLKTAANSKKEPSLPRSNKIAPLSTYLDLKYAPIPEEISAKTALVFDVDTRKIIYFKNIESKQPIASLTKIATFLIAVENKPLDSLITISNFASSQEPDSMGLFPGEKLTLKQLLHGLVLVSGNDSAEAIAETTFVESSRQVFINKMNEKAHYLGMDNTHFVNPTGFDEDFNFGYSTGFDMLLLAQEAIANPTFLEIAAKRQYLIPEVYTESENHKSYNLINTSPTIDYPGYLAGKPGFTPSAGKCQITYGQANGKNFMVIILGSEDRKSDTEKLFNWAGLF